MIKTLKKYGTAAAVVTAAAVASFLLVTGLAWRAEARGNEAAIAALEPLPATGPHIAAWAAAPVEAAVEAADAGVVDAGDGAVVATPAAEAAEPAATIEVGQPVNEAIERLASPVDPVGDPAGTLDLAITWWKAGWFKPLGILVFFVLLTLAKRRIAWLGVGYRLAVTTVILDATSDVITRLAAGIPLTAPLIIGSLTAALLLFLKATGTASMSGGKSGGVATA
jgi:hypothetical protein